MAVLHLVPLPGIEPGLFRGFAMIVELSAAEPAPSETEATAWESFAALAGARAVIVVQRNLVVLGAPDAYPVEPGPCPIYMPTTRGVPDGTLTCDLRDGHRGLHEHVDPVTGQRATWGVRVPWAPPEQAPGFVPLNEPE